MLEIKFRARRAIGEWSYFTLDEVLRHANAVPTWVYEYPAIIKDQYIGLKDKNGKEIYEGDIIKSKGGAMGEVKWRHFGFEQDMINTLGWWVIQEDGEVIGNIYENPELLK